MSKLSGMRVFLQYYVYLRYKMSTYVENNANAAYEIDIYQNNFYFVYQKCNKKPL